MNIIEQWGSGIPRIIREVSEYGLREPEFVDMECALRINIYRNENGVSDSDNHSDGGNCGVSGGDDNANGGNCGGDNHSSGGNNYLNGGDGCVSGGDYEYKSSNGRKAVTAELSENAQAIIEQIRKDNTVTVKEMSENTGIPKRTVERILGQLKEKQFITRCGSARKGYWCCNLDKR